MQDENIKLYNFIKKIKDENNFFDDKEVSKHSYFLNETGLLFSNTDNSNDFLKNKKINCRENMTNLKPNWQDIIYDCEGKFALEAFKLSKEIISKTKHKTQQIENNFEIINKNYMETFKNLITSKEKNEFFKDNILNLKSKIEELITKSEKKKKNPNETSETDFKKIQTILLDLVKKIEEEETSFDEETIKKITQEEENNIELFYKGIDNFDFVIPKLELNLKNLENKWINGIIAKSKEDISEFIEENLVNLEKCSNFGENNLKFESEERYLFFYKFQYKYKFF